MSIDAHFIDTMFRQYKNIRASRDAIVLPIFKDILNAPTKKDWTRTSLSTYLAKVSYIMNICLDVFFHVSQLDKSVKELHCL